MNKIPLFKKTADGNSIDQRSKKMNIMKPLVASTLSLFLLSGCYKEPGLVQDTNYERTKTGVAAGAVTGALIGYNTRSHNKGQGALIGGLLGAVAGGAIGYSLDQQANEVAHALGTGVSSDPLAVLDPRRDIVVTKTDTHVRILFRDRMMFATDSSTLRPSAKYKVQKVAQLLQNYPQTIVGVAGFTDSRGSYSYNKTLSTRRARHVADLLAVNAYPAIKGCSFDNPLAPNDTAENMALNRRVEVYLFANRNVITDPCR
jgi:outer membrane protein OmpA-like peptidoglycan-associated protein